MLSTISKNVHMRTIKEKNIEDAASEKQRNEIKDG